MAFEGAISDEELPAYYAAADLFVMPNRVDGGDVEGFGIVFLEAAAAELKAADVVEVVAVGHAALEAYTADGFTAAAVALIADLAPTHVVFAHTYQTRDYAPRVAARLDRAIATDVIAVI